MNAQVIAVTTVEFKLFTYPAEHWRQLKRFAVGEERDPQGLFRLTDDKWEMWPYAVNGRPSLGYRFRLHFSGLQTFLKLYAKWYCYHQLVGSAGGITRLLPDVITALSRADRYIRERGFHSIDEIAPTVFFQALWDAQLTVRDENAETLSQRAVSVQSRTRIFWRRIRAEFGVPHVIPPIAPHVRTSPTEFAADESQVIPNHVIKQLMNKLALHRDKVALLNRYDHLRLCVLGLQICLGRRIEELLSAPRGTGRNGPLTRRPSASGTTQGALWFQFRPNKNGPGDKVYISPRWEDVTQYCVSELVKYGDEIRHLAVPIERDMLILVSTTNHTWGMRSKFRRPIDESLNTSAAAVNRRRARGTASFARPLRAASFLHWINGYTPESGVLQEWGITTDGRPEGRTYRLLTKYTRHTRQSALALDENVSLSARQQDLNHQDRGAQFTYQHRLKENNDALLIKIKEGKLIGHGAGWLAELLEIKVQISSVRPEWKPGSPSPLTPRIRALIRNNPAFMQLNRVPCGLCALPQGPGGCAEYLNCTSACEGGCHSFVVDVTDPLMLHELNVKARRERQSLNDSVTAGRLVQAGKREVAARRTEELLDEALRRASKETLTSLRELQIEVEEKGL